MRAILRWFLFRRDLIKLPFLVVLESFLKMDLASTWSRTVRLLQHVQFCVSDEQMSPDSSRNKPFQIKACSVLDQLFGKVGFWLVSVLLTHKLLPVLAPPTSPKTFRGPVPAVTI